MRQIDRFILATMVPFLGIGCDVTICGDPLATCPENQFCKFAAGRCDEPKVVGVCTSIPDACDTLFDPVCGCDGQTYSNPCLADTAGVSVEHFGPCGEGCCDPNAEPGVGSNPTCFEGATCCSDGQWRCNEGDGSTTCDEACDLRVCGGIAGRPCERGEFCKLNAGECCCDFQGVCSPIPDACIEIFQPVCGCDGETYSNECFAWAAGVSVDHSGQCE